MVQIRAFFFFKNIARNTSAEISGSENKKVELKREVEGRKIERESKISCWALGICFFIDCTSEPGSKSILL